MSPTINTETAGKERNKLARTIGLALREIIKQPEPNLIVHDVAAYLIESLGIISNSVDASVSAWEKRGYWVKADRFRLDWEWSGQYQNEIKKALDEENWASLAGCIAKIGKKLSSIKIAEKNRLGTPWVGAWEKYKKQKSR
jgi:hypothetical protein